MFSFAIAVLLVLGLIGLTSCARSPQQYVATGNLFYERGKYKEARTMYLHAVAKDPKWGAGYFYLGLAEEKNGDLPAAAAAFRKALELLPGNDVAARTSRVKMADLFLNHFRTPQNLQEVETIGVELLKTDPRSFDGRRFLGEVAFIRAEWWRTRNKNTYSALIQEALDEFMWADRLVPNQQDVLLGLARTLAVADRKQEAERIYQELITQFKDMEAAYGELYRLLLADGKLNDARDTLTLAVRNVARPEWFLTMLAAQNLVLKNNQEMISALEQMKGRSQEGDRAFFTAGDFYLRSGDLATAAKEYRSCESLNRRYKPLCEQRIIDILLAQGKTADAAALNGAILKINPRDGTARARRLSMNLTVGTTAEELTDLESVALYDPKNFQLRYQIARAHLARNEVEQARQSALDTLELKGDFVPAWTILAEIQFRRGEYVPAATTVSNILQLSPENHAGTLMSGILQAMANKRSSPAGAAPAAEYPDQNKYVALSLAAQSIGEGNYTPAERYLSTYEQNPAPLSGRYSSAGGQSHIPQHPSAGGDISVYPFFYLKDSPCDEAIQRFRVLQLKPDDPFVLASQISGIAYPLRAAR